MTWNRRKEHQKYKLWENFRRALFDSEGFPKCLEMILMWLLMICKLCMVCGTNKEIISKGKYLFEVVYLKIVSCHFSHHASLCSAPLIIVGVFPGVGPHNNRMIDASRHRTCPWISTAFKTLNSTEKINLNYTHKILWKKISHF